MSLKQLCPSRSLWRLSYRRDGQRYDGWKTPDLQLTHQVDRREYDRVLDLAKSLDDQKLEMRHVAFEAPQYGGMVSIAGSTRALKASGGYEGELSDPSAVELVKLISGWCPAAAEALLFERIIHRHDAAICTQPDPNDPIRICTPR
jgi:hypothetical protein